MSDPAAEWVNPAKLQLAAWNPRKNDHAVDAVAKSIERFGFASPLVATKDGVVIAGNTRLKAARQLGLEKVPVRYVDMSETDAKLFAQADNRLGEIAEWAFEELSKQHLEMIEQGITKQDLVDIGWSEQELFKTLGIPDERSCQASENDGEADSKLGMSYQLGQHTLICGSSADAAVWEDAPVARMVWTDPPYGVNYASKNKMLNLVDKGTRVQRPIVGDELTPDGVADLVGKVLSNIKGDVGAAIYCACASGVDLLEKTAAGMAAAGWLPRWVLAWVKNNHVLGRADYMGKWEPIIYGWREGAHMFNGVHTTSVFQVPKPHKSTDHPTMKPVDLVVPMVLNSSNPGEVVVDPFGGSGSTLMACAETGRKCFTVEIEPMYCDVIRRRFTQWADERCIDVGSGKLR